MFINKIKYYLRKYYEYLIIILIFLLIFYNNLFKELMFLDFIQNYHFQFFKFLHTNGNDTWIQFLDLIRLIFSIIHLDSIIFQSTIFIAFFISYYYIKKISKHPLFFSFIYFFNPFIYSRIITGQLSLIMGYLLFPVLVYHTIKIFNEKSNNKDSIIYAIIFSFFGFISLHFLGLSFIVLIITAIFYFKTKDLKKYLKFLLVFSLLSLSLNAYWFQSLLSDKLFSSIDTSQENIFSPQVSDNITPIIKVMGMWGFWRENTYLTTYASIPISLWYLLVFILVILMFIGYYVSYKDIKSKLFYSFWWIGLILGTGFSNKYTSIIFNFLFNNIPLFNGFRDSHKFVIFICLSYAYFCPLGLEFLIKKIKKYISDKKSVIKYGGTLLFIVFILFYTYPLIGLGGQIQEVKFPKEYEEANLFLKEQNNRGYIIYLPWENYLKYNWTEKVLDGIIATPINQIIEPLVIVGSARFGFSNELQNNISYCLNKKEINCLEQEGVQLVVKDVCALYSPNYSWINKTKVFSQGCLEIQKLDNRNKSKKRELSLHFILGHIISLITLFLLIIFLRKYKPNKKEKIRVH